MKKLYGLIVVILVLFSLIRCDKGMRAYDTTLTVKPALQYSSGGDIVPDIGWKGYYFEHTDTMTWYVKEFADAKKGIFKHRYTPPNQDTLKQSSRVAEIDLVSANEEWVIFPHISTSSAYLLIVHEKQEVYAYRQMDFTDGLDNMWLKLPFLLWKWDKDTKSVITNKWNVIFEDGGAENPGDGGGGGGEEEDKGYPAYMITTNQLVKGTATEEDPNPADRQTSLRNCQGYYVLVDNLDEFTVTSYKNVVDSTLTRGGVDVKLDKEYYFGVEPQNISSVRFTKLPYSWVFMVVYSEKDKFYAYRTYIAQRGTPEAPGVLNVPLYRVGETYEDEEGGWTVVIPSAEDLEEPEDPTPEE